MLFFSFHPGSWWGGDYFLLNPFQLIISHLSFPSKPYILRIRQCCKINHSKGKTWGHKDLNFQRYDAIQIGNFQSFEAVCCLHHQRSPRSISWDLLQRICLPNPDTWTGSLVMQSSELCSSSNKAVSSNTGCNHWRGCMITMSESF